MWPFVINQLCPHFYSFLFFPSPNNLRFSFLLCPLISYLITRAWTSFLSSFSLFSFTFSQIVKIVRKMMLPRLSNICLSFDLSFFSLRLVSLFRVSALVPYRRILDERWSRHPNWEGVTQTSYVRGWMDFLLRPANCGREGVRRDMAKLPAPFFPFYQSICPLS